MAAKKNIYKWLNDMVVVAKPGKCVDFPFNPSQRYGLVYHNGEQLLATRVVYGMLTGEPVPAHLEIRHTCGRARCVNPHHLVPGTHAENERDKREHGTARSGETHPNSRLTEELVREIRASTEPTKAWARHLGVSPGTVRRARRGESWAHL